MSRPALRSAFLALSCIGALCAGVIPRVARAEGPAFTAAQAERGEAAYMHNCRACHGDSLDDGDFGGAPLRGAWFRDHWGAGDVATLFAFTKSTMPPDGPGSLNDETYTDIIAFILSRNGYAPGTRELPHDQNAQRDMSLAR
jgi:mono/diheme cytochrome c family protein